MSRTLEEDIRKIVLARHVQRAREDAIPEQQRGMLRRVNNKSHALAGWTLEIDTSRFVDGWGQHTSDRPGQIFKYEMYFNLVWRKIRPDLVKDDRGDALVKALASVAAIRELGRWTLETVDGEVYDPDENEVIPDIKRYVGYTDVKVPEDFETHFDHLYGLDAQVARIKGALQTGVQSEWDKRFNCALIGPPGCGKSDVCQTVKRALGDDAVMEYDATATTAAGVLKDISEREILPRVICIEEIEKADPASLLWCLAALDQRAEIRKTTYRDKIQMETKLFGICTVNSEKVFNGLHSGALASRFQHKIYFNRPSRQQLEMILQREVRDFGGDLAWINPTLDWCESIGETDPRYVIAVCLSGQDQWLEETASGLSVYRTILTETAKHKPAMVSYEGQAFEDIDFGLPNE